MKNWKDLLPRGDEFSISVIRDEDKDKAEVMRLVINSFIDACPENPEPGTVAFEFRRQVLRGYQDFVRKTLSGFIGSVSVEDLAEAIKATE